MKTIIVLTLLSASSFACPDLAGNYLRCQSTNSKYSFEIKQSENGGITTYHVNRDVYHADGRPEVQSFIEPNTGVKIEITTTANCEGEGLKSHRTFAFDGEILGKYDTHIRKENGKLKISNFFKSVKDELNEEINCL